MKNKLLHLLINPPKNWDPDWAFFARDASYQQQVEGVTESAIRAALHMRYGECKHVLPILLALERHEWSRWLVRETNLTYRFEWFKPPATEWSGGRLVPSQGAAVWPPRQDALPLASYVSLTREGSSLVVSFDGGATTRIACEFMGNVAVPADNPIFKGRVILASGAWTEGSYVTAGFHPAHYPWAEVLSTLDAIEGNLDFLNVGGTLDVWHNSNSPVEKVACYAAALVNIGLSRS